MPVRFGRLMGRSASQLQQRRFRASPSYDEREALAGECVASRGPARTSKSLHQQYRTLDLLHISGFGDRPRSRISAPAHAWSIMPFSPCSRLAQNKVGRQGPAARAAFFSTSRSPLPFPYGW